MGYTVKEILKLEVAPALGCTEPSAVALCAAVASSLLDRRFDSIELWLDPNTYKNGIAVSIPGAPGHTGIDLAAALGAFGGDPALKLEVLEPIDPVVVESAVAFVDQGRVEVHVIDQAGSIYVRTKLRSGEEEAEATIERLHDNITSIQHNGAEYFPVAAIYVRREEGDRGTAGSGATAAGASPPPPRLLRQRRQANVWSRNSCYVDSALVVWEHIERWLAVAM